MLYLGTVRCQWQAEKEENLLGGSRPLPWAHTHPKAPTLGGLGEMDFYFEVMEPFSCLLLV